MPNNQAGLIMFSHPVLPRPDNEQHRLEAVRRYALFDTDDPALDVLVEIAADLCRAPFAQIVLVGDESVLTLASFGIAKTNPPRNDDYNSLCILNPGGLFIEDLRKDERTMRMLPTLSGRGFRMFAGLNLLSDDGYVIGVLSILDTQPRELTASQKDLLAQLAKLVVNVLVLKQRAA
jgi:hypothetical protein